MLKILENEKAFEQSFTVHYKFVIFSILLCLKQDELFNFEIFENYLLQNK